MSGHKPPPRLQKTLSIKRDDTRSALEVLLQMGFSKERSQKAIAATGDRGAQLATDWLISHVSDPHLDDQTPRQYTLYLCPSGKLEQQLQEYYDSTLAACGWNGFHSYFPHITLCSFFSIPNDKTEVIKRALRNLEPKLNKPPGKLKLDYFGQPNYIAFFLCETYFKYFQDILAQFAQEIKQYGIEMASTKNQLHVSLAYQFAEDHHDKLQELAKKIDPEAECQDDTSIEMASTKNQLHISLAYQFAEDHHDKLQELAKKIDPEAECQWEVRVYSRDQRLAKSEVRRVIKGYKADLEDELDLIMGDFVIMDTNESGRSEDGWYTGTSWLTGMQGMFPGNFTVRTAETWTWAMHGSIPLGMESSLVANGIAEGGEVYDRLVNPEDLYAKVNKKRKSPEPKSHESPRLPRSPRTQKLPRKLFVMRHGERMDFVFGRDWCDKCFDNDGNYKATDLNMPKSVPKRAVNYLDYCKDAPLTTLGKFQAFLTGEALKSAGITFQHVYVSPSLRCLETVTAVLNSIGISPVLHVEPGLFEWLGWYQLGLPRFFSVPELKAHGFNVDLSYKPRLSVQKFDMDEDIQGYYKRSGDTAKYILQKHQEEGGNVLIVGHAGTLEVCTRQVLGYAPRSDQHFREMCGKVPYCSMFSCLEDTASRKWSVLNNPIPQLTHGHQKNANIKNLLYPS